MQIFYTDKGKVFECQITVEGSSIGDTRARVIMEVGNKSLIFNGKIDENGKCSFSIPALKDYNIHGDGKIIMEVIAETTLFEPFSDQIEIKESKKVGVTIIDTNNKKEIKEKISVKIISKAEENKINDPFIEKKKIIIDKLNGGIKNINEKVLKSFTPSENVKNFSKLFEKIIDTKNIKEYQYIFENIDIKKLEKLNLMVGGSPFIKVNNNRFLKL